jgi:hypothetical protein
MSKFGQIINELSEESDIISDMYDLFDYYFDHPTMTRVRDIDDNVVYMTKIRCLLSRECMYIVAIVKNNKYLHPQEKLKDLFWESLQTRTMFEKVEIPSHEYRPKKLIPLMVPITRTESTDRYSSYMCEKFPINITILNKKEGPSEYQDKGTIVNALETYQTIITINRDT